MRRLVTVVALGFAVAGCYPDTELRPAGPVEPPGVATPRRLLLLVPTCVFDERALFGESAPPTGWPPPARSLGTMRCPQYQTYMLEVALKRALTAKGFEVMTEESGAFTTTDRQPRLYDRLTPDRRAALGQDRGIDGIVRVELLSWRPHGLIARDLSLRGTLAVFSHPEGRLVWAGSCVASHPTGWPSRDHGGLDQGVEEAFTRVLPDLPRATRER